MALSDKEYQDIDTWQARSTIRYGDQFVSTGDTITITSKSDAKDMYERGLIHPIVRTKSSTPQYRTKEDKDAYTATNKAYKKHLGGGWYEIRREGETLEKVQGQAKAESKLTEYNA